MVRAFELHPVVKYYSKLCNDPIKLSVVDLYRAHKSPYPRPPALTPDRIDRIRYLGELHRAFVSSR
jgi:hypothetical protein